MFLFLISILTIIFLSASLKNYFRFIYLVLRLPGPPALPIIGNGLIFWKKTPAENFRIIGELIKEYGYVTRLCFGNEASVILSDPKDVEFILTSQKLIDKAGDYGMLKSWLNEGLLLSTGKKWFQRRKALTPAFHFKILEEFVEIFNRQSNVFIDVLSKYKTNDKVDLYQIVTLYALDIVCETAMGVSINAQLNTDSAYARAVKEISHVLHVRMFDISLRNDFMFNRSDIGRRQREAIKILHEFTDKVIRERREELIKKTQSTKKINNDDENDNDVVGIKKKMAFLDILLNSNIEGKPLSDSDIREEVDTFMFEGHDTSTTGITFCLYNLAKNPKAQEKCYQEICDIIGNDNKEATYAQLNNLNYLEKVIKETLRMFPPVPIYGRNLKEDILINGRTYPAGVDIMIPAYFMGKDPKLFVDPEHFWPERFDDDNRGDTFAYVPFSAGPRNCIGQKFAMLGLKSVIAKTLLNYQVTLADDSIGDPSLVAEIVLKPENSINFHVKAR